MAGVRRPRSTSQARLRDQHKPLKKFGQHFLTDQNILNRIVDAALLEPGEVVLEIGPGLGHLTRVLAERGARVVAVEVDRELGDRVAEEFRENPSITVLVGDFLSRPVSQWFSAAGITDNRYAVVANLPYNITSAILRHLLESQPPPRRVVVLVQREVAQQMVARPPHMSLLAVSVQFYSEPRIVSVVPAGAFYPRPQVDSAVVALQVKATPEGIDPARFFEIVRAGFGTRRKQLRNSLASGLKRSADAVTAALLRAGIEPTRRAETLSQEEWLRLCKAVAHIGNIDEPM